MSEPEQDRHWHLDRRVPLALIVTILLQTGGIVWWAAGISARVDQLEKQHVSLSPSTERIVRVETKLEAVFDAISEIKVLLRNSRAGLPP